MEVRREGEKPGVEEREEGLSALRRRMNAVVTFMSVFEIRLLWRIMLML